MIATLTFGHSSNAHANTIYSFDYTVITDNHGGTNYSGFMNVDGATVIGITGTSSIYGAILSLLPVNAYAGNDNALSPDSPYLTYFGISFSVDGHGYSNIYANLQNSWSEYNNSADIGGTPNSTGTLTITEVVGSPIPEPTPLSVFAAGLAVLSIAGGLRLRNASARRTWAGHAS